MNRRDLLKKTGAGAVAGAGLTGVASARSTIESEPVSEADARSVLRRDRTLFTELSDDDVLATPRADELSLSDAKLTAVKLGDERVPVLQATERVEEGQLTVGTFTDSGRSFAILDRDDGDVDTYGIMTSTADCSGCEEQVCYCDGEWVDCPIIGGPCCDGEIVCTCVPTCPCPNQPCIESEK